MKREHCRFIVLLPVLWLSPLCFGQALSIRVVNADNGHPLPKQNVTVSLFYDKDEKKPAKYDAQLILQTNGNGEAQFRLPEPTPLHFWAQVRLDSEYWHCFCMAFVSTQELAQKGIVVMPGAKSTPSATNANAGPGQIVFLARPFTFLERLFYPLEKD